MGALVTVSICIFILAILGAGVTAFLLWRKNNTKRAAVPTVATATVTPTSSPPVSTAPASPFVTFSIYSGLDFTDPVTTSWPTGSPPFSSVAQLLSAYPTTAGLTVNSTAQTISLRTSLSIQSLSASVMTYALAPITGADKYLAGTVQVALTTPTQILPGLVASLLPVTPAPGTTLAPTAVAAMAGTPFTKNTAGVGFGANGRLLSCSGTSCSPGAGLRIFSPYAGTGQQWTYNPTAQTLVAPNGLCLEVNNFATADHSGITTWLCNSGANQQWAPVPTGTGYALKNPYSNKCLDVVDGKDADGTAIQLLTCSGGASQTWT